MSNGNIIAEIKDAVKAGNVKPEVAQVLTLSGIVELYASLERVVKKVENNEKGVGRNSDRINIVQKITVALLLMIVGGAVAIVWG